MFLFYNPLIYHGENKPISHNPTQLFHHIQCKRYPAWSVCMIKTYIRIKSNPFQRRAAVASLSVRTAAGTSDGLELRDLPADAAGELLAWFRPLG